jgi:hypothetical protein
MKIITITHPNLLNLDITTLTAEEAAKRIIQHRERMG